ncbi:major facilitator superfamily domain-containing protein [Fusarium coicis]|nr:major facilitator superfamily domain-containing protein [Fusarium coicis]
MRAQGMSNTQLCGIEEPKVPGTIDMTVTDDSQTAYGLCLTPTPSADPNDPLNWTPRKKYTVLFLVSAYSFLANGALIGPSVYVNLLAQQFGKTPSQTSQLFCGGLLGCALSNSYNVLMGFRMVHGFGPSVCEALPAQAVADVFFFHERGKALGWYTWYFQIRSFTYFIVPRVFWVCATYGMVIGLAGLAFTSTFPTLVAAPPYSWPIVRYPSVNSLFLLHFRGMD